MSFLISPYVLAVVGPATSISFQASATSTVAAITAPASIVAGDIIVLADRAVNIVGLPTKVVPTGFTEVPSSEVTVATSRAVLSYKIATGTEGGVSINGMDGNLTDNKVMLVFRANVPGSSVTIASVNAQGTAGDPTAQNVAASVGIAPLVVLAAYGVTGAVDPRTMSPAKDAEISSSTSFYFAYKIYNTAPADVSVDMDDEGANNSLQSFYMQVA